MVQSIPIDYSLNLGKTTMGHRYWKDNDTGAIVIFDKQGTIAGIQLAVSKIISSLCLHKIFIVLKFPRSSIKGNYYSFDNQKMFNRDIINGVEMYTLTAYFIDPGSLFSSTVY